MLHIPFLAKIRVLKALRRGLVCAALSSTATLSTLPLSIAILSTATAARADQYAAVPLNDVLYKNLSTLERNGWTSKVGAASSKATTPSTRYELALQTASAIFLVTAYVQTESSWVQSASPSALEALRNLTTSLRPELQKLGVDTGATLRLLARANSSRATSTRSSDALVRDVAANSSRTLPLPARFSTPRNSMTGNDVSLGLGRGFALRAGLRRNDEQVSIDDLALRESQLPSGRADSLGGGLDWAPLSGLTFSTDIEKIRADSQRVGTRISSGFGLSTFNNRVSLFANVSRLKMENRNDASTLAGVNVGVGVTQNVSLNLLYQRLFSTPSPSRSDQVLAGGVSIKF